MCSIQSEESGDSFVDLESMSEKSCQSVEGDPGGISSSSSPASSGPPSPEENSHQWCQKHEGESFVENRKRSGGTQSSSFPKRKKVNYDSVSSLSVSSSPEEVIKRSSATQPLSLQIHSHYHKETEVSNRPSPTENKEVETDFNHNNRHDEENKGKQQSQPASKTLKLSFGIDRILSDENTSPRKDQGFKNSEQDSNDEERTPSATSECPITKSHAPSSTSTSPIRHLDPNNHHSHHHHHPHLHFHNPMRCSECYFLGRFCRTNGNANSMPYSTLSGAVGVATNGPGPASFSPWMSSSIYENSPLLSPSAYHPSQNIHTYGMSASNFSTMSSLVACNTISSGGRRKRSWSRAVFSSLQRKGLEKRFQIQKYITKPDRRQLAATLGLTDAQVKVWFQNRRMKWRHSKEGKVTSGIGDGISSVSVNSTTAVSTTVMDKK